MKMIDEMLKRKVRYFVNNNFVAKIFMRLYYNLWLIVSVGLFVFILKMFFSSF